MANSLSLIPEFLTSALDDMTKMRNSIMENMIIPRKFLIPNDVASTFFEVKERIQEHEKAIIPFFNEAQLIISDLLPKHYVCIGHNFYNPPPSKNRSLRLWKKLRYGKRRCLVEPIMVEEKFIFVINDIPAMQRNLDDMAMARMCGVIRNIEF